MPKPGHLSRLRKTCLSLRSKHGIRVSTALLSKAMLMREVIAGILWIGNARDARDIRGILDKEITAVVDLAAEEPPIVYPREIVYCRFPLLDGAGNDRSILQAAVDVTVKFIGGQLPTIVACSAGMSRSPAIVAAAIARTDGILFDDALRRIAATGPCDIAPSLLHDIANLFPANGS